MKLVYFEEFKEEFDHAVDWYNSQVQGLGNAFAAAVATAIEHIQRILWLLHRLDKGTDVSKSNAFPTR